MTILRTLGKSGIRVSALGLGTARIGGLDWQRDDLAVHYRQDQVDAAIRAIHRALDLGIDFFDTADVYGGGHSERILGQALAGRRHRVVIATKFGDAFDEQTGQRTGEEPGPAYIRRACQASLRRLDTDYIDLYLFHIRDYDLERAGEVRHTLEDLVDEGKIRKIPLPFALLICILAVAAIIYLQIIAARESADHTLTAPYQPPPPLPEFVGRQGRSFTTLRTGLVRTLKPGFRTAITGLVGMGGLGKSDFPPRGRSAVLIITRHEDHSALRGAQPLSLAHLAPAKRSPWPKRSSAARPPVARPATPPACSTWSATCRWASLRLQPWPGRGRRRRPLRPPLRRGRPRRK